MKRDFEALSHGPFDLLVIGGGIYGAWTAYDAALRGWRVALVEKSDWAAGTSSASSKLIHGGLRYLEHFNFGLVHHGLEERATLGRIAPHAVEPLHFVIPCYADDRVPPWRLGIGLWLYDTLAGPKRRVSRRQRYGPEELREIYPYLDAQDLVAGFAYGDCQEDDARLTLDVVSAAREHGATVVNHAAATQLLRIGEQVVGAEIEDRLSGAKIKLRARATVNAAGPWAAALNGDVGPKQKVHLIKGSHLVMPALPGPRSAFLLTARSDGRVFFVLPWYNRTLIGTTESTVTDTPGRIQVTREEAEYLLGEARQALKPANWGFDDICGSFAGVRTLMADSDAESLSAVSRDFRVGCPAPGLRMPLGGKFTTARGDAEQMVDGLAELLGPASRNRRTNQQPLPCAPSGDIAGWLAAASADGRELGMDELSAHWSAKRHGVDVGDIHDLIRQQPEWAKRLHAELPFCRAEVVYAAQSEMAVTLIDVLRRRMPLTLLAPPDRAVVEDAAILVSQVLGWSADEQAAQINATLADWSSVE